MKVLINKQQIIFGLIGFGLALYYSLVVPALLYIFLMLITLLMLGLAVLRILYSRKVEDIHNMNNDTDEFPFVSIHIAICNEPPEMVINTLKNALAITYPNYEIIVLDNNTKFEKLWKPVESFCKSYPDKIKFEHIEKLSGFKAGALNRCLKIIHCETRYIFTIDADYLVEPDCISTAINESIKKDFALVQFPQFYVSHRSKRGILKELEHFFTSYANGGNKSFSTLPTGTLSFIKLEALQKVGGWPERSLTEDARLGLDLLRENFKTRFSNKCIGRGVIPGTIEDLKKQRNRWVYGNAQCILDLIKMRMSGRCKFSAFMQLIAWINLLAIPIVSCLLYIILSFIQKEKDYDLIPLFISLQFGIFIIGKFILLVKSTNKESFDSDLRAFFIHLALSFEMAFAFWPALVSGSQKFVRTSKFKAVSSLSSIPLGIPLILVSLTALLSYQDKDLLAGCCFILFSLFLISSLYIFHEYKPDEKKVTIKNATYENRITGS
ncbi:glycosyltransferase family 2 protein [Christiangramia echinicola]|uniref:glycosyltransferase family 2 protein n=1 Tax=Christiangramia echinicola TaxID=279359 RepID=UPI000479B55B|nr:glycosyltransferase family 2 protein [Christiangramia echinicola]